MKKTRISALDGLRGLAILAVIFTHIPLGIWYSSIPKLAHPFLRILLGSGDVGVNIFFILTGFFMGWLHPIPRTLSFWSRRYARLFPTFLVMVFSLTVISLIKNLLPLARIVIVLVFAITGHCLWKIFGIIKRKSGLPIGRGLLVSWMGIQIVTVLWYMLVLLKVPSAIFYQKWDPIIRHVITGIVNATLTLPFGQYIDQLDGVYWALAVELLFSLIYPIVIVPIFYFITHRTSLIGKSILTLALIPFCYGLYLVNQRILGFGMLNLHLIIYFLAGVAIGLNMLWFRKTINRFRRIFIHPMLLWILLLVIFGHLTLNSSIQEQYFPWIQILTVFPTVLLLLASLETTSYTSRWLSKPILIFFGKYSYALFLTHSFVIHIVQLYLPLNSVFAGMKFTIVVFLGSIIISIILSRLVEQPYFLARKQEKAIIHKSKKILKKNIQNMEVISILARKRLVGLTLIIFTSLYLAYKPPLSTFTGIHRYGVASVWSPLLGQTVVQIGKQPVRFSFLDRSIGLGMIISHIRNKAIPGITNPGGKSQLLIRLRNENDEIIAESSYETHQIIDSRYHPFGFPIQTNSKGNQYTIEYQLSEKNPAQKIELISDENDFFTVHFFDKKVLQRQPLQAIKWFLDKLSEPLLSPMFWFNVINIGPFILIINYFFFFRRLDH